MAVFARSQPMPAYPITALVDQLVDRLPCPVPHANTRYAAASFSPRAVTLAQIRESIAKNSPPFFFAFSPSSPAGGFLLPNSSIQRASLPVVLDSALCGAGDLPPSRITFASSLSRIMVQEPTFTRCKRPCESQAWTVHLLMPPKNFAASGTEYSFSASTTSSKENLEFPLA